MRLLILIALISISNAATLECFTDEPKVYNFDIGDLKTGRYENKIDYLTGIKAGMRHHFVIKDVASPRIHDDYLTKSYMKGRAYSVTYALHCKTKE